jgi:hypothetical protein
MKRMILVLMIIALLSVMLLASSGLPALAQEAPGAPQCDWYKNWLTADPDTVWWEYWCWWPGWGWEFVFWVWA